MTDLIKDPEAALTWTAEQLQPYAGADCWVIPQSGGKDSRATGQAALLLIQRGIIAPPKKIIWMMSDTLLEFWTFVEQAKTAMQAMSAKTQSMGIQSSAIIVQPIPQDDFWIRIIGYGYAPPSANMRWCTDKLKITPMNKMRRALRIKDAPVFLGVRYGESDRRDKILSCTVGGECGPDAMLKTSSIDNKVMPIVRWRQCAVWDFLTLIAPSELGLSNQGLINHYGPDGSLRYGCWSCPLIYNDKTAEFLKTANPILHELIVWTNTHFREGAAAWRIENREYFLEEDARLSLRYCQDLYDDLIQIGAKYGIELLSHRQRQEIQAKWEWRANLPDAMQGYDINPTLGLTVERTTAQPLHINSVTTRTADTLAITALQNDDYHRNIKYGAEMLMRFAPQRIWRYTQQGGWNLATYRTYWQAIPSITEPRPQTATVSFNTIEIEDHATGKTVTTKIFQYNVDELRAELATPRTRLTEQPNADAIAIDPRD